MLSRLFRRFSEDIGIDLGTSNTRIFTQEQGIVIQEPSLIALNNRLNQIIAVGQTAKDMIGKTPPHIETIYPLSKGIISDFEVTEKMLKYFFDTIHDESFTIVPRPLVVIGVPLEITEVERKAVEDAVLSAGARSVHLIENCLGAAIGAGLPAEESTGNMIVDIGGGKTEIAVISLSGIVTWKSSPIAGNELTKNIIQYSREVFNLLVGETVAEQVKIAIGNAKPSTKHETYEMRGRDLISGLPKQISISDDQIFEAMRRSLQTIIQHVKSTLEATPPELVADIYERGIMLVGGGSQLKNFAELLSEETEIPVHLAEDPNTCLVRGLSKIMNDKELLSEISLPSTSDEGYTS